MAATASEIHRFPLRKPNFTFTNLLTPEKKERKKIDVRFPQSVKSGLLYRYIDCSSSFQEVSGNEF